MDLQRPGRHVVQHLGHRHLHAGDVLDDLLVVLVAVDLPRGLQHQQPELLQLHPRLRDHVLHHLQVTEPLAAGLPGHGALEHHVQRLAHQRHGAHGVVDASAAEPDLRDLEAIPLPPSMWSAGIRTSL